MIKKLLSNFNFNLDSKFASFEIVKIFSRQLSSEPLPMPGSIPISIQVLTSSSFPAKFICIGKVRFYMDFFEIKSGDKVLEIGAATGFGAAILCQLAGHVVLVESDGALINAARENLKDKVNVSLIENDLAEGFRKGAPYDVILIAGTVETVPEALFSQLSEGGRLIAAVGNGRLASCCVWTRSGSSHTQRYLFDLFIMRIESFKF